jgi:hypothetical protein
MTAPPAVETKDLVKVFEGGRRTIWQRIRREPDKRDRFHALVLVILTALTYPLGRCAFARAELSMRRRGMLAQY